MRIILTQPRRLGEMEEDTLGCKREEGKILVSRVTLTSVASGPADACTWLCAPSSSPWPTLAPLALPSPTGGIQLHAGSPQERHTALLGDRAARSTSPPLCSHPGVVAFSSPSACPPACRAGAEIPHVRSHLFGNKEAISPYSLFMGYFVRRTKEGTSSPRPCHPSSFSDLAII